MKIRVLPPLLSLIVVMALCQTSPFAQTAAAVSSAGGAGNQNQCRVAEDHTALQRVIDDWKGGYNEGDAGKVAALYTEDAYYLTQHFATGVVAGRAAIRAYVQLGVDAHYRIDSIQMLAAGCSGDFAYVITRYDADNAGQKVFGVNLVVLRKTEGRWRIVAHEAAVPDAKNTIQKLDTRATE